MNTDDLLSRRPRTKRVFSEADMARMRDLYYDPGVPMPDAADAFGVPVSTLMRWIAEMRWPRKSSGWRPAGMAPVAVPRREAIPVDETTPHPAGSAGHPLPQGERVDPPAALSAAPLDPDRLAVEIAAHARTELAAMGDAGGPMNANLPLVERKRRADIIASLSRSIARIDKTFEARAEREGLKRLVKSQQDKIYTLENAGLIETQKLAFAALKAEFEKTKG
jgi:transposase-like protein